MFKRSLLTGAVLGACSAMAQVLSTDQGLQYQLRLEAVEESEPAAFVLGDHIDGVTEERVRVQGNAELRREDIVIKADTIDHDATTDVVQAQGHVRVIQAGNVMQGPQLVMDLENSKGLMTTPDYQFLQGGQGYASVVEFQSRDVTVARDVRHSTCARPPLGEWMPDWMLSASSITFDRAADTGTARNAVVSFQGVPLLVTPWLEFPLSEKRRSGFLPPTFNLATESGFELTVPYYLNVHPQVDATLYPTLMTKRGVDLAGEVRYLLPTASGSTRLAYMPSDSLRDEDRWGVALQHQMKLDSLQPGAQLGVTINRVSDDNYWQDFPRTITSLTSRLLSTDVVLSAPLWGGSASAGSYTYQTLQQPDAITVPYDRLPHLTWTGSLPWRVWNGGFVLDVQTTQFDAQRPNVNDAQNGWRSVASLQWSRSFDTAASYIRPSVRAHARHYALDRPMTSGVYAGQDSASVVIPTFSIDSGLFFEREAGESALQTLEPRAMLSWTQSKLQTGLPNYDSGDVDFNMSSIFSPFPISGNDRVADMKALTLGMTSRWLDRDSGRESWSVGVAQRLRLEDQEVQTSDSATALTATWSDVLVEGRLSVTDQWSGALSVQVDQDTNRIRRTTSTVTYTPSNYRSLSVGYSFQRDTSELAHVAWQWPLNDLWGDRGRDLGPGRGLGTPRWYSVGRLNYSVMDRKLTDMIAGFEYDAGCWVGRVVLERLQTSTATSNQRILFQLELNGFSRLGSSPLALLQSNIPRYQYLRQEVVSPSRFVNYE